MQRKGMTQQEIKIQCQHENECLVCKMKNNTGVGSMTMHSIFQGVDIIYNDFHMQNYPAKETSEVRSSILIDYCKEGRIEWEMENGEYLYLTSGNLMIDSANRHNKYCSFPLSHYHGITIAITINMAINESDKILDFFKINLMELNYKYGEDTSPCIIRDNCKIDHIFAELYSSPEGIYKEFYQLKILELLVWLKGIDISKFSKNKIYFNRVQVEKTKAIMALITDHPETHYTIKELSGKFGISESALKSCFKGIYGTSVFSFIREYRMNLAAEFLSQTTESVIDIAGKVGYQNSSKFSEAFKKVMGKNPNEFRKIEI